MKYIKLYQNESDYLDEIGENIEAVLPNISLVGEGVKLNPNPTREAYFNTDDVEDPIFSTTNQFVKSIFSEMYLNDDNENLIKHYEIIEGSFTILSDTDLELIQLDEYSSYWNNTSKKSITARNIESYIIECDEPLLDDYFIGISFAGGVAGSGGAFPPYGIIPYSTLSYFFSDVGLDINDYRIDENTIDITTVLNKVFGSVGNLCVVIFKGDSEYNIYPINTHNHYKIEELPEETFDVLNTFFVEGIVLDFKLECDVEILPTDVLFYCGNGEYYEFDTVENAITNYGSNYGFGLSEDGKSIVPNENFVPIYGGVALLGIMRDGDILSHECKILGTNDNFYIYPDKLGENKIRFVLKDRFTGIDFFQQNRLLTRLNNNALDYNRFIPYKAYWNCSSLTNINIPKSVTSIGENAFEGCSSLTSINIPDSVTSIGDYAFRYCSNNLTSVNISSLESWLNINFNIKYTNPLYYAKNLYLNGQLVTDLVIPDSVTSIGDYAFWYCLSLTSVTIPDSVTSIGDSAFYDCSSLPSITIPNSVTSIGVDAFHGCSSLTSITIPNSVTSIGSSAFFDCSSLTSITIPNSVTSIDNSAFRYCSKLTSINIPDSVTSIEQNAFEGCSNLTSVTIGNGVTSIKSYTFSNCTSLSEITSYAMTAPTVLASTFRYVKTGGVLKVPTGATGYDAWMSTSNYYLGYYNWTIEYI